VDTPNLIPPDATDDAIYPEPLEPERVRFFRDASGRTRMTVEDDRSFLDVRLLRAFPISAPQQHIAVVDETDRIIGHLNRLDELDASSQGLARRLLEDHYFLPTILRIRSLREEFGTVYCAVETDKGLREFAASGFRDLIEDLGDGQLLIADADGNRYRVRRWQELDRRSRNLLEQFI